MPLKYSEIQSLSTPCLIVDRKSAKITKANKAYDEKASTLSKAVKELLGDASWKKLSKKTVEKGFASFKSSGVEAILSSAGSDFILISFVKLPKNKSKTAGYPDSFVKVVLDSLVNLVAIFNLDFVVTDVNRTILDYSGYSKSELLGRHVEEFLGDQFSMDLIRMDLKGKERYLRNVILKKKSGEPVEVFASVSPIIDDGDQVLGYVASMRVVTEIKEWREKLAFVEDRYTDLFQNASDLIHGVGVDGKLKYANTAWYNTLGYSKAEMKGMDVTNILIEDQRAAYSIYLEKVIGGTEKGPRMWTLQTKTGEHIYIEAISDVNLVAGDIHSVRSIMRDITNTRKTEEIAQKQAAKIDAIFEGSRMLFWTVNMKTALTSFNSLYARAIYNLYGKYPEIQMDESLPKPKFADDHYHSYWEEKYAEVIETGRNVSFQTETVNQDGTINYREIYLNPIWENSSKKKMLEIAGMAIDITDKKEAEKKIKSQSEQLKAIFNSTPHMIWAIDLEGRVTSMNKAFAEQMKERFGITMKEGTVMKNLSDNQSEEARIRWQNALRYVAEGNTLHFEMTSLDMHGTEHIDDIFISPIFNDDGEVVEISGLSQTVTFKKTAELKLKEQAAKISAIFDSSAMLIWTMDQKGRLVSYNKVFADSFFSLKGEDISLGSVFIELIKNNLKPIAYRNIKRYIKAAFKGEKQQFEGVLYNLRGKKTWMETFVNPIYSDNNEIREVTCMSYEITDKKEIQQQMKETIQEKEILLQEVHHRVKNNLQVISSILNLQSSYVKDENSLNILRESQNRIKSMSFIHESLYHTGNFSKIEFSEYIHSLAKNLIHSYSLETAAIELDVDFQKTSLLLDQAIPCGLIANEILSNALKYAFKGREKGKISCRIGSQKGKVTMEIGDDGVGLPPDLDVANSETLGLQLVYTLIEQLSATIQVDTKSGTNYLITFDKQ